MLRDAHIYFTFAFPFYFFPIQARVDNKIGIQNNCVVYNTIYLEFIEYPKAIIYEYSISKIEYYLRNTLFDSQHFQITKYWCLIFQYL